MLFSARAFRTWGHVLVGASLFALSFVGIMLAAEHVVEGSARFTRATKAIGAAAFVGYVGTAWLIRREAASRGAG